MNVLIGASGYSFPDWIGPFYPRGTRREAMFDYYAARFATVELNFTYYRMPTEAMMDRFARKAPEGFTFWVKANQQTTHKGDRSVARAFLDSLAPLRAAGKLSGVLLQFPQSFHRTVANRTYLAATLDDLAGPDLAVEFRHRSWAAPAVAEGLRDRRVALVVPDVPPLPGLYHSPPTATCPIGYLRLHSRNASAWYAGGAERYDYLYSDAELTSLARAWTDPSLGASTVFAFFNNCHRGQAAENARRFAEIVDRITLKDRG